MGTSARPIDEIQARISQMADRLERIQSDLPQLMSEVEKHLPDDTEAIGEDEVCPPLEWDVHGELGQANELVHESLGMLRQAAASTTSSVREAWLRRRLKKVDDPATRSLLRDFAGIEPEPAADRADKNHRGESKE